MSVADRSNEGSVLDREDSFIGKTLPRANAARLVAGQGKYVDDLTLPRMVHVVYYRSPYAHARILSINDEAALASPGAVQHAHPSRASEVCHEAGDLPRALHDLVRRAAHSPDLRDQVRG